MKLIHRYILAGLVLLAGALATVVQWGLYRDSGAAIATGAATLFIVFLIVGDE